MSFDLAVWFEPDQISDKAAADKYLALCSADDDRSVPTEPHVAAFYRELTSRFPSLDDVTDDDVDQSAWTAGLSTTNASVVMPIAWTRADEVADVVRELARRHGLICFDPQARVISRPDSADETLTLSSCNGPRVLNPDESRIEQTLLRISRDNWFAILERGQDDWVQVGYGEHAGTRPGWYGLERRDGSAERHYRTIVTDLHEVIRAFQRFAVGDDSWPLRFTWSKIDLTHELEPQEPDVVVSSPPTRIAIDHDDYHAEHIGHTADGRQFFLTTPFVPKWGGNEGQEFVALFLFDAEGGFLEARIDALGTRAAMDSDQRRALYLARLQELGTVTFDRIEVAPFSVNRFGTTFGLLVRDREHEDESWCVELHPGNYMAFTEPWDSGTYDT